MTADYLRCAPPSTSVPRPVQGDVTVGARDVRVEGCVCCLKRGGQLVSAEKRCEHTLGEH